MKNPSFILVNCLTLINGEVGGGNGRSVAFPVARTKSGKVLFATCSHTIVNHLDKGLPLHILYEDEAQLPLNEPIRNNVIHPSLNFDLSFFEVSVDRPIELIRFSSRVMSPDLEISHVRNVSFNPEFEGKMSVVTKQTTGKLTGKYLLGNNIFHLVDANLKSSFQTMLKVPHRGVAARSWRGVSGSPLWDKYGAVLGMVAGGTETVTSENPNYNLIYLPSSHIQSCMKTFLHDRIVK